MTDPYLRDLIRHILADLIDGPEMKNTLKTEVLMRSQSPWPPNATINQAIDEVRGPVVESLRK